MEMRKAMREQRKNERDTECRERPVFTDGSISSSIEPKIKNLQAILPRLLRYLVRVKGHKWNVCTLNQKEIGFLYTNPHMSVQQEGKKYR